MPSLICANPRVFTSPILLVIYQIKFQYYNSIEQREVNERACIGEVGVDLEPCVHAHGHDVDLIIKASLKLVIPLV